jgi:hypothetical protein
MAKWLVGISKKTFPNLYKALQNSKKNFINLSVTTDPICPLDGDVQWQSGL